MNTAFLPSAANGADAFLARYRGLRARLPGDATIRDAAAEAFATAGLPSVKSEAWRYTSLRPLAETSYGEPLNEVSLAPVVHDLPELPRIVLIDGRYQPGLSTPRPPSASPPSPTTRSSTTTRPHSPWSRSTPCWPRTASASTSPPGSTPAR